MEHSGVKIPPTRVDGLNLAPENIAPRPPAAEKAFRPSYPSAVSEADARCKFFELPDSQKTQLEVFEEDDAKHVVIAFNTVLKMTNDQNLSPYQTGAYYLSMLGMLFPSMRDSIDTYFEMMGFLKEVRKLPSEAKASFIEIVESDTTLPDLYVFAAQLIFVPFKCITNESYTGFMISRIKALASKAGAPERANIVPILTTETARRVRRVVGCSQAIRERIIEHVIGFMRRRDSLGAVMAYVAEILEYTEMNAFKFIYEVLVLPKSPVLWDEAVLSEVVNYCYAVKEVCKFDYPQFFRIMCTPIQYHMLDRSKFPTLIDVAVAIKAITYPSVNQFATPEARNRNDVINRLKNLHIHSRLTETHPVHIDAINFMLQGDPYIVPK